MNDTINYYNLNAESFVNGTVNADMSHARDLFLKYVKPGGRILDAGCGSGRDSLAFMAAGYEADAFDASAEICRIASERLGFSVVCKRFEDLDGAAEYDGIWCCASLLHVRKADMADVMRRLERLLKPEGAIYVSFKKGDTERVKDGRFFNDMTLETCENLLRESGFEVLELYESGDVREGREDEKWINAAGKKRGYAQMMSSKLRLEKFDSQDQTLYETLVFNKETMEMNLGRIFTAEEAQLLFNAVLEQNAEGTDFGFYKVFAVQNGREEFIGMGAITQNDEYGAPEIEYMLLPQFWNRGYGSELVGLLIKMAQDNAKIVAITDPANIYSKRILLKKGFRSVRQYENDDGEQAELFQKGVPL